MRACACSATKSGCSNSATTDIVAAAKELAIFRIEGEQRRKNRCSSRALSHSRHPAVTWRVSNASKRERERARSPVSLYFSLSLSLARTRSLALSITRYALLRSFAMSCVYVCSRCAFTFASFPLSQARRELYEGGTNVRRHPFRR